MKVYVELVILNNFAVTFLIARLSYLMLSVRPVRWRMLTASALGTAAALCYPFIPLAPLLVLFKIGCGLALCAILFTRKKPLKGTLFFFILTFTFGGAMFGVGYFIHGSVQQALTLPFAKLPVGAIIFAAYALFLIIKALIRKLFKTRDVKNFLYRAQLKIFDKSVECQAFLDSGNRLYDDQSGLPIVVASVKTLTEALSDEHMTQLMTGKTKDFKNAHYVDCNSVGGRSKMLVFQPDGLVVYNGDKANIINDVMLGVVFKRLSDAEGYGLILNPALMIGV